MQRDRDLALGAGSDPGNNRRVKTHLLDPPSCACEFRFGRKSDPALLRVRLAPESGHHNGLGSWSAKGGSGSVTYTSPTTRTCASGFASMYLCVVRRLECPASS